MNSFDNMFLIGCTVIAKTKNVMKKTQKKNNNKNWGWLKGKY